MGDRNQPERDRPHALSRTQPRLRSALRVTEKSNLVWGKSIHVLPKTADLSLQLFAP
jgi:hypothetical protein